MNVQAPATCTSAALTGDGRGTLVDVDLPPLERGMVLVRVTRTMVSAGTHLGRARQLREQAEDREPTPLGYQSAGRVEAVGEAVTRFKPGDRVAGFGSGAKHAQWNVIPQNLCAPIPDNVSDDDASGMNLVLTAVQANRRAETVFGEYVLVVGMGIVGQLSAQVAGIAGARVMGWDTLPFRLDKARGCGIDGAHQVPADDTEAISEAFTDGLGFDAAILAFGGDGTAALQQVTRVMKLTPDGHRMGRVVIVGGFTDTRLPKDRGNIDFRNAARTGAGYHDKAWEIGDVAYPAVFVRWTTQTHMQLALRWLSEGKLRVDPLITHRFDLERFDEAVDLLVERPNEALGVVLRCDHGDS